MPDGVLVRDPDHPDARPRLAPIDAPTDDEVRALLDRIIERVTDLVRPRLGEAGEPDDVDLDNPARQLEAFAARPVPRGASTPIDDDPGPRCARKDGWSLHANIAVHRQDRLGLERLARYCLRPPISPARLRETEDGHILYLMKRRGSDGTDTLRLTPRELVLRLCALIPPPRSHLVRYFGLLAGHSRGRFALTGRGLHDPAPSPTAPRASPAPPPPGRPRPSSIIEDVKGPDDPERAPRLPWAERLRRVWRTDVLVCARCGGDMRVVAIIDSEPVVLRILRHLGYPTTAPPRGPPRPVGQLPLDLAPGGRAPTDGVDPPYVDN
jgi:hypothetical protein